jgi:hypothetical protein
MITRTAAKWKLQIRLRPIGYFMSGSTEPPAMLVTSKEHASQQLEPPMPAMPDRQSPTIRRRRLSRELRKLRVEAGRTAEDVWRELGWSQGKLSRLEQADFRRVNPGDVHYLLDFYGVTGKAKETLVALAKASRERGWWETPEFSHLFHGSSIVEFEAEATRIYAYQPLVIPGLLQTPVYARELLRRSFIRDPEEIKRRVDFRMNRQQILTHPEPPMLWAILDEGALRRPFGTVADREEQIQRLIDTSDSEHITVQVIPFEAGLHVGLNHAFSLMDYEGDPSIAHVELDNSALYLETPEDLDAHSLRFQRLQSSALDKDATVEWLQGLLEELK